VLVAAEHYRLRIIEDDPERDSAGVLEREQQGTDQRLDPLVRDDHDPDPARVLQTVGGKMDARLSPIEEPHVGLAEVELGKLAGHAFEPDHQLRGELLLLEAEDPVEGALAELAQQLQRGRLPVIGDQVPEPDPHIVWHGRAADGPAPSSLRIVGALDRRFLCDALNGALRDAELQRDLLRGLPRLQ
jgi:hypothetical protein